MAAALRTRPCKLLQGLHEWTTQNQEQPIEPLLPIIDPHHHLWTAKTLSDPDGEMPAMVANTFGERNGFGEYLLSELQADMADNNVVATQFVECGAFYEQASKDPMEVVKETAAIEEIRSSAAVPMTIISHADLSLGPTAVRPVLEAHMKASSFFRGIRDSIVYEGSGSSELICMEPQHAGKVDREDFQASMRLLGELGLTYESWLYHTNIDDLAVLAKRCPGTTIVCDHVAMPLGDTDALVLLAQLWLLSCCSHSSGCSRVAALTALAALVLLLTQLWLLGVGPYKRPEVGSEPGGLGGPTESTVSQWKASITRLAECENVFCKLGGLTMPVCGFGWERREVPPGSDELAVAMAPFFHHCISAFGASRCMFESNFPPDKASCSYTALWNAFKKVAASCEPALSEEEMTQLFSGTAARVYRIPLPTADCSRM